MLDRLFQALVDGVLQGSVLSLAAVGFSLIFGVLGVINLSHGVLIILGAYLALVALRTIGLDPLLALPLIAAICFGVGYLYQRFLISPAIRRASLLSSLLVTYGVALILQNLFTLVFSADNQSVRPDYANSFDRFGGITVNRLQLIAFAISCVLIAILAWVLRRLPIGRSIRATAEHELAARLCGVDTDQIYAISFGLSAAFAGAAGVLIGMLFPFAPSSQEDWTIFGFVVVVLGGAGSAAGALLGGLLLGIISALTGAFVGPAYPNAVAFLVLVLMLLLRPHGLLGSAFHGSR